MNEFKREERYIVFKISDLQEMVQGTETINAMRLVSETLALMRAQNGQPPREYVVVESDWPEYDHVWRAIEARMTGDGSQPVIVDCTEFTIGPYTIRRRVNGLPWVWHEDGEGMQTTEAHLLEMIQAFYNREF
jgi:hypothetical protein